MQCVYFLIHMKRLIFAFMICISSIQLCAQTISGTVLDAQTKESIPFCTIVLGSNSTNGTIANVNGDYIVNNAQHFDSIAFSAVGYERKVFSVAQLMQDATVMLQPRIYQISEIVVKPINIDSLLQELRSKVLESYPNPYPVLGGVYRKQMVENGKLAFLGECELFCTDRIVKGERGNVRVATENIVLTKNNTLFERFMYVQVVNCVQLYYAYNALFKTNNWTLHDISTSDDGSSSVYVFRCTLNYYWTDIPGFITIHYHVNDNAILSMDYTHKSTGQKPYKKSIRGNKLYLNSSRIYSKYEKNIDGKYVLKYARTESDVTHETKKGERNNCIYTFDYVVTNNNVTSIQPNKKPNYDPFRNVEGKVVEQSELRVIPPDYEL